MNIKRKFLLLFTFFLWSCLVCACGQEKEIPDNVHMENTEEIFLEEDLERTEEKVAEQWVKGYDLPIEEEEREEAENDCKKLMELIFDTYERGDIGKSSNTVLKNETVFEMQKTLKDAGYPVTTVITYSNMENYEIVDRFLIECQSGKSGSAVIYEIHADGGIERMKFIFDGTDMYAVSARGIWKDDKKPGMTYISYNRIKKWKYTEKGWFCYELCVPEPPEVSEIVDGSCLLRVKPMTKEQREMSERCVRGLGYQGNNLLCSNWNADHNFSAGGCRYKRK